MKDYALSNSLGKSSTHVNLVSIHLSSYPTTYVSPPRLNPTPVNTIISLFVPTTSDSRPLNIAQDAFPSLDVLPPISTKSDIIASQTNPKPTYSQSRIPTGIIILLVSLFSGIILIALMMFLMDHKKKKSTTYSSQYDEGDEENRMTSIFQSFHSPTYIKVLPDVPSTTDSTIETVVQKASCMSSIKKDPYTSDRDSKRSSCQSFFTCETVSSEDMKRNDSVKEIQKMKSRARIPIYKAQLAHHLFLCT